MFSASQIFDLSLSVSSHHHNTYIVQSYAVNNERDYEAIQEMRQMYNNHDNQILRKKKLKWI